MRALLLEHASAPKNLQLIAEMAGGKTLSGVGNLYCYAQAIRWTLWQTNARFMF